MLQNLYIKNFAIINEASISFEKGFTAITGETGAGKSILMGALSLVMGARLDSKYFLSQNEKCIVEAEFEIGKNENVKQILHQFEFDTEHILLIRREIYLNGKSRAFVNDTPATLNQLTFITEKLVDLHRQFDTIELQQASHQLEILDQIISNQNDLNEYAKYYEQWKQTQRHLQEIKERNKIARQEFDYNQFVFQELENLAIQENEIETCELELNLLENATSFKQDMQAALYMLSDGQTPVLNNLKQVVQFLENHLKVNPKLQSTIERLQACHIELKDLQGEIEDFYEHVNHDEERIQWLQDRLNESNRLLKKHHLKSSAEIIQFQSEIEAKILQANHIDEEEKKWTDKEQNESKIIVELAKKLHHTREKNIPQIEQSIQSLLKQVGMVNAVFKIQIETCAINAYGQDKIEFLLDANKTQTFKPLSKVASGGELSRILLCIKSVVASNSHLPTLIFDEIDTGISGEAAIQVGNIMSKLAMHHQLICITHLPQIAGKANQHLFIFKQENQQGNISTHFKKLENEERVEVLAEMLGGKNSGLQTKEMVKEFLKSEK